MGNICRSPTAEGVFRKMVRDAGLERRILVDSAGTHAYHVGEPPDARAQTAARRRGVELQDIRARRFGAEDFLRFDYILAMDRGNLVMLEEAAEAVDQHGQLRLFLEFSESARGMEVPDPYYGGTTGFERVLDLIEDASRGLLAALRQEAGMT